VPIHKQVKDLVKAKFHHGAEDNIILGAVAPSSTRPFLLSQQFPLSERHPVSNNTYPAERKTGTQ
jgi:hypothetical protein